MSNMSYCRFRNTLSDLIDCQEALEELVCGRGEKISRDEAIAAARMAERCVHIAALFAEEAGLEEERIAELSRADAEQVLAEYVEA